MKRNQCLFCKKTKCSVRIVRTHGMEPKENDTVYDEIACAGHVKELEKHSDMKLGRGNGVVRAHVSGGRYRRGDELQ